MICCFIAQAGISCVAETGPSPGCWDSRHSAPHIPIFFLVSSCHVLSHVFCSLVALFLSYPLPFPPPFLFPSVSFISLSPLSTVSNACPFVYLSACHCWDDQPISLLEPRKHSQAWRGRYVLLCLASHCIIGVLCILIGHQDPALPPVEWSKGAGSGICDLDPTVAHDGIRVDH